MVRTPLDINSFKPSSSCDNVNSTLLPSVNVANPLVGISSSRTLSLVNGVGFPFTAPAST